MSKPLMPERKEEILTPGEQREIRYYIRHKDEKDIDLSEIPAWLADLHKERDALQAKLQAALEVIKAVEWVNVDEGGIAVECLWCGAYYLVWHERKHEPNCPRQAVLAMCAEIGERTVNPDLREWADDDCPGA